MLTTGKLKAIHETKFNSIYAGISLEDFRKLGFEYGDSIDVYCSSGLTLLDAPYYDGYYASPYNYLVCGYSSYPMPSITYLGDTEIWWVSGLKEEGDTVEIVMHEKGKYAKIQETFCQYHPSTRDYYVSDEAFANFRPVVAPNMKENFVIRGGTPVRNDFGFMKEADELIRKYKVNYVINLSETEEEMAKLVKNLDGYYIKELYDKGNVISLDQSAYPRALIYAEKIVRGLRGMIQHEGPMYFHCVEGKDRTGFMSILLMALCGGDLATFEKDYMQTYQNFYYVDKESTPEKYELIRNHYLIGMQMNYLCNTKGETDFSKYDFHKEAEDYLRFGGMNDDEIQALIRFISK